MSRANRRVKVAGGDNPAHLARMTTLSRVGELVRQHDPDRFFTTLFAPQPQRDALWALYAFNHELARARETVREPMMALIRLQWWREIVEGARRRHEVADPVRDALDAGALRAPDLLTLIEGREADPPQTPDEWRTHVDATAGALAVAAAHALGADMTEAIRAAGAAYGAAGTLRNRALAGEPKIDLLQQAATDWLADSRIRPIPRRALPAALPAVLARRDLRRARPVRDRGAGDKLAVLRAAALGRI